jgi:hypothetical protein
MRFFIVALSSPGHAHAAFHAHALFHALVMQGFIRAHGRASFNMHIEALACTCKLRDVHAN